MSRDGVELKIKGSVFKTDILELFSSVLKTIAHIFVAIKSGGASLKLAPNAVSGLFGVLKAFKREETPELRAWILVSGGLLFAVEKILTDFATSKTKIDADTLQNFSSNLAERIAAKSYTIEPDFFSQPNKLLLLDDVSHELSVLLNSLGGTETHKNVRTKLERFFPAGLHRTWMKEPIKFELLELALNSPFAQSLRFANECDG